MGCDHNGINGKTSLYPTHRATRARRDGKNKTRWKLPVFLPIPELENGKEISQGMQIPVILTLFNQESIGKRQMYIFFS
jgi:hypothetical protein